MPSEGIVLTFPTSPLQQEREACAELFCLLQWTTNTMWSGLGRKEPPPPTSKPNVCVNENKLSWLIWQELNLFFLIFLNSEIGELQPYHRGLYLYSGCLWQRQLVSENWLPVSLISLLFILLLKLQLYLHLLHFYSTLLYSG